MSSCLESRKVIAQITGRDLSASDLPTSPAAVKPWWHEVSLAVVAGDYWRPTITVARLRSTDS
jgi:hypothetical protein